MLAHLAGEPVKTAATHSVPVNSVNGKVAFVSESLFESLNGGEREKLLPIGTVPEMPEMPVCYPSHSDGVLRLGHSVTCDRA